MTMVLKRPNESESQPAENRPNAEPLIEDLGHCKVNTKGHEITDVLSTASMLKLVWESNPCSRAYSESSPSTPKRTNSEPILVNNQSNLQKTI